MYGYVIRKQACFLMPSREIIKAGSWTPLEEFET